jgi:hypothetical protein
MRALVRPELGPTLPELAWRRFGLPPLVTLALVVLPLLLLVAGALALRGEGEQRALVRRAPPAFSLLYDPARLHPLPPRPGEYARLEARGRAVALRVSVAPLPAGTLPGLPIQAARHVDALRAALPGLELREEGGAQVNGAPGYEVQFRAGPRGRRTFGTEVVLMPAKATSGGVLLSLRQRLERPTLGPADQALVAAARRALGSFSFGTERP